jgi:hypothetical protein
MRASPVLNSDEDYNSAGFSLIRFNAGVAELTSISSLQVKIKSLRCSQIVILRESSTVKASFLSTDLFTQAVNFLFY